uniref:DNA replication ATP-dependent helicase/nuclease n=1 Tax=Albugo laibachii Nc14 TaxID=890382 RepID=F0WFL5_9STRA|nr:DNA2like helicase putative [Albugo laibachii Nc14]CCA23290.1 DNA2like helicase putative [Albugo laibachii Nc14]|eukprot:CCA23290.1 DNA2like helicase putative [Albugo laibachii Nc14]
MSRQERTPRKKKVRVELVPSPHVPERRSRRRNGLKQPNKDKIVWKDSPAAKQIQSSGTGNKSAVQQEIKGFLCRLTRSSDKIAVEKAPKAQSPRQCITSKRSRQLYSSPIPTCHPKSSEKPDNWMQVLDQMEQKYDDTKPLKHELVTPPKQKPDTKTPIPDLWSPLTEESWKLLDQLESQAAQRPGKLDHLHAVVLETEIKPLDRQIRLGLYTPDTELSIDAVLSEDWYDTDIRVGDTLNLIFLQTTPGIESLYGAHPLTEEGIQTHPILVNNKQHAVIMHPNVLVNPTSVTTTFDCVRRAWIRETWRLSASVNPNALLGTLKHELFQEALTCRRWDLAFLLSKAQSILQTNALQLFDCGMSQVDAMDQLQIAAKEFGKWMEKSFSRTFGLPIEDTSSSDTRLIIDNVLATEEAIWSTKWGLKGAIDATLLASFSELESPQIVPLELKTGAQNRLRAHHEHRGQVLLYTLLLGERYGVQGADGILMYSSGETIRVRSLAAHIRGLVQARNRCASSTFRSSLQASNLRSYPPMLQRRSDCERCFQLDACVLHHYAMEDGDAVSSGLDELFSKKMEHLSGSHLRYFQEWMRVLELEERFVSKDSAIGWNSGPSSLMDLQLSRPNHQSRTLCLYGSMHSTTLTTQDRVLVSVESTDKKKRLLHVARGRVVELKVQADRLIVYVETLQPVPKFVLSGQSLVGTTFSWRLDQDASMQAFSRARENLIRLMISGDCVETSVLRRQLIDLEPPKFALESFENLTNSLSNRRSFMTDFEALNADQRIVVCSVLNALDYTLVLGMPGTGKTFLLAFIVRVLLARGLSVLITSYTHSAVDHLLGKIVKGFGDESVSMLRIGAQACVNDPMLAPYVLETTGNACEIEAKCLETKLIGITCLSIPHHAVFRKRQFDFCIVDEATQITEPIVLGALACAKTFVLVGDPHQLPPLVKCPQAREKGLNVSLFQRLSEVHPGAVRQLTIQYRMNEDIMQLVNHLVYKNQLKCGNSNVAKKRLKLFWAIDGRKKSVSTLASMLENQKGVTWINTDPLGELAYESKASTSGNGASKMVNEAEARVILALVEILIAGGVQCEEIAIVSPFRAQVSRLEKLVWGRGFTQVEVCTIDRYQGRDRGVVFISFVRCNASGRVGELLSDRRRLNVALTRAKQRLVLVGSMQTLEHADGILPGLIDLVGQAESPWEFPLTKSIWEEVLSAEGWSKGTDMEPEMEVSPTATELMTQVMVPCGASDDIEELVATSHLRHVR